MNRFTEIKARQAGITYTVPDLLQDTNWLIDRVAQLDKDIADAFDLHARDCARIEQLEAALTRISCVANGSRAVRGQFGELMQEAIDIADEALDSSVETEGE